MSAQMDSAKWADETFRKIISVLKRNGLYRASPKFFIIYAHENDNLQIEAKKELVTDYISWFKKLLFNVNSDKSPHGYQPAYSLADEGRSITGASTDIIHNQLCLLPHDWHGGNVDYVLVFYSELLAQYMHDERDFKSEREEHKGQTYSDALFKACKRYDSEVGVSWEQVCESVRRVQKDYEEEMGVKFHHVLTELALLDFRNRRKRIQPVIPILLFDDQNGPPHRKWQSSHLHMADTVIRLQYRPGEEHRLFFKILKEFDTLKDAVQIIDELENCYVDSVNLLQTKGMKYEEYVTERESKIGETLKNLNDAGYLWKMERPITQGSIREILNLHSTIDRASIKRISGQKLPVNLSDISLEVVEPPGSRETEPPKKRQSVLLHGLFDETEGDRIRPKRVFIQGRPGIGKTTLSRRAMFDYSCHDELQKKFDLVVRIPVRKLEQLDHLTQVLYDEYFQVTGRGDELAKKLSEIILDESRSNAKLLIILDGLDEARQWSREKLEKLMNRHAIMITSRSYEAGLSSIDLHLEAVGLTLASIEAYVRNTEIVPRHIGKDILAFIQHKPYIKEMLRVPILLDILCYSWDELRRQNRRQSTPSNATQDGEGHDLPTMTHLYQAVVRTLWRQDIPQLDKRDHGERVTREIVNAVRDVARLEQVVCAESNLLGEIGINMIKSDRVEFADETISEAIQRSEIEGNPLPLSLERNLSKLSFIRLDYRGQRHHFSFVHLTFQEYFAAQWLTEHREHLKEYLREHKYSRRFENVWRFVAGMLQAEKGGGHLVDFFSGIEDEPRDLLGPGHQRLIMRCLSEVSSEQKTIFNLLRSSLEGQLYEWLVFEYKHTSWARLASEIEAPEEVLFHILQQEPDDIKDEILFRLRKPQKMSRIIGLAVDWLKKEPDYALSGRVLDMLRHNHATLSPDIIEVVRSKLHRGLSKSKERALRLLASQSDLSIDILTDIVEMFKSEDLCIKLAAAYAIQCQATLPEQILEAVAKILEYEDKNVQQTALDAIENRWILPEYIQEAVVKMVEHTNHDVREKAGEVFATQSDLPPTILDAMGGMLEHKRTEVQVAAIKAFGGRSQLPPTILEAVVKKLEHKDSDASTAAERALENQSSMPNYILETIVAKLEHESLGVRASAVRALKGRSTLPHPIIEEIAKKFEHKDPTLRLTAIRALGGRSSLPHHILEKTAAKLKDEDVEVIITVLDTLGNQSNLPEEILKSMAAKLECKDEELDKIRRVATGALRGQSSPPQQVPEATATKLSNEDTKVASAVPGIVPSQPVSIEEALRSITVKLDSEAREEYRIIKAAARALGKQSILPLPIMEALAAVFLKNDKSLTSGAAAALKGRASFPQQILEAIAALLKSKDNGIKYSGFTALEGQSELPDWILKDIVAILGYEGDGVAGLAAEALRSQSILYPAILKAIAAKLKNKNGNIIQEVLYALEGRSNLPPTILKVVAAKLEDVDDPNELTATEFFAGQSRLPGEILCQYIQPLYKIWLSTSFREHLCWFFNDKKLYIERSGGCVTVDMSDHYSQFMAEWEKCRKDSSVPPQNVL